MHSYYKICRKHGEAKSKSKKQKTIQPTCIKCPLNAGLSAQHWGSDINTVLSLKGHPACVWEQKQTWKTNTITDMVEPSYRMYRTEMKVQF